MLVHGIAYNDLSVSSLFLFLKAKICAILILQVIEAWPSFYIWQDFKQNSA